MPDAAGLVIATDHEDARAYAACSRRSPASRRSSCSPTTRPPARRSARSPSREDRWLVAVRMVSEGVDIPRLAVGVYATSVSTALFFAQAVGQVRPGQAPGRDRLGVPAVGPDPARLRGRTRGRARSHPQGQAGRARRRTGPGPRPAAAAIIPTPEEDTPFLALAATAHFDRVLYDGGEFGASPEDEDFIGLPGLLEPDQVTQLLRQRHADQLRKQRDRARRGPGPGRSRRPGSGHDPPDADLAAQGTECAGRRLASPHRPAARRHPRRSPPHLRRPGRPAGHRGPDHRPDRRNPPLECFLGLGGPERRQPQRKAPGILAQCSHPGTRRWFGSGRVTSP